MTDWTPCNAGISLDLSSAVSLLWMMCGKCGECGGKGSIVGAISKIKSEEECLASLIRLYVCMYMRVVISVVSVDTFPSRSLVFFL